MNLKKFILGTVIVQILMVVIKVTFIKYLNIESWVVIILMWLVLMVVVIAAERRQGILNYLEDFLLTIIWTVLAIVIDLLITIQIVGTDVLRTRYFWFTYAVLLVTMVVFHKKEHIANRQS